MNRYTLRILNAMLGENMSSRLFQVVRERHGLAYYVNSSFQLLKETGALVISAGLDRKKHRKATGLIVGELVRLKESPAGAVELKRAKDYIIGQLKLGLESTRLHMMWIGDNLIAHRRFVPPEEVIDAVSAVTAPDVRKLAASILRQSRVSLALIAPNLSDTDDNAFRAAIGRL